MRIFNRVDNKNLRRLNFLRMEFLEEVEFWLIVHKNTQYPSSIKIRRPLCIELYEFAHFIRDCSSLINKQVKEINKMYSDANRDFRLKMINKNARRIVNEIISYLRDARNQVVAHRYKDKNGNLLTLPEMGAQENKITINNLKKIWKKLTIANNMIEEWLKCPNNKNHLIL